jgi:hypothetical protein
MEYPYPTEDEKLGLVAETGLSKKQIENWFSRTRQRKFPNREPNSFSNQNSATSGTQASLQVLPAYSSHSEDASARARSEDASQTSLETNHSHETPLKTFHGPMLSWWLRTPDSQPDHCLDKWSQGTLPVRSCPRLERKLERLPLSLNRPYWFFAIDIERSPRHHAFLRLLSLLELGTVSSQVLETLDIAFLSLGRPQASILDNLVESDRRLANHAAGVK